MAYTAAALVAAYTAANDGVAPDAATSTLLTAFATQTSTGQLSDNAALAYVINSADKTTAVAVESYQFFGTAKTIPSKAGLDFLVNSPLNPTDLNEAPYTSFNIENRYMNFAANLGIIGEGATAFNTTYGTTAIPLFSTFIGVIYETIIGSSYAAQAGINVTAALNDIIGRQAAFTQIARERGIITSTSTQAQIDIATRAVAVGYLLVEGIKADVGIYAAGANNFTKALIDGTAQYGVNLLTVYSPLGGGVGSPIASGGVNPGIPGTTFNMIPGVDSITGTANDDTFNGAVIQGTSTTGLATTFSAFDTVIGAAGNDTLNILITDVGTTALGTGVAAVPAAAVSGVETVNVRIVDPVTNAGGATTAQQVTLTATNFAGATAFYNDRSTNAGTPATVTASPLQINALASGQAVGIVGLGGATVVQGISADYSTSSATAANYSAIVNLTGGTGSASTTGPVVTLTSGTSGGGANGGIGTVTINSTGSTANVIGVTKLDDAAASTVRTLNINATVGLTTGAVTGLGGSTIGSTAATTVETITVTGNSAVTLGTLDGGAATINTLNITTGPGAFTTGVIGGTALFNTGATINVSGGSTTTSANTASVTLGALVTQVTTLNASGLTAGGVNATVGSTAGLVFTGGSGTDVITMAAGKGAGFTGTLNAGAGSDIIAFTTGADLAANLTTQVTGFEILRVSNTANGTTQTYDPTLINGITSYQVGAVTQAGAATALIVNNLVANPTVLFNGSSNATTTTTLNLANATGATDVINIRLDNLSTAPTGGAAISINSLLTGSNTAPNQVETLNITSAGKLTSTGGYNSTTIGASGASPAYADANTINLLGAVSQTLITGNAQHAQKVDASASTASVFIDNATTLSTTVPSPFTLIGSAKNDTIASGNTANIFGGLGGDAIVLTPAAGNVTVQTIVYKSAAESQLDLAGTYTTTPTNTGTVGASLVAGTANASTMDIITGFTTGVDKIDLGQFKFTGALATNLNAVVGVAASDAAFMTTLTTAGLFSDGISTRAVAVVQGASSMSSGVAGTFVVVDVNSDGVYTAGTDLVIKLTGITNAAGAATTALGIGDFSF